MTEPREHCGHLSPETGLSAIRTECVLRPGHSGSHADDVGCRWRPVADEQPAAPAGPAPATDRAAVLLWAADQIDAGWFTTAATATAELRRLAGEAQDEVEEPETDEQRADREETERDHASGDHRYCDQTCEVEFPTEHLRNFVIAKGYPGTKGALDELLRRAAVDPAHAPGMPCEHGCRAAADALTRETQQDEALPRCTCGDTACESELCDCDSAPCPVDHAGEAQQDPTQDGEFVPPVALGLPAGTLEAAEIGANRLDAWARTPNGRNFLAHALVQLARTGWLRTEPGEGFEPVRDPEPQKPAVVARPGQPETEPEAVVVHARPEPGDNGISRCCGRPPHEFVGERLTRDPDKVTCRGD
jgi:hypothetical protein